MKYLIVTAFFSTIAVPGFAGDVIEMKAEGDVATAMDRLVAAVEATGATVFARVDHGAGAASVDMPVAASELLIFGNPRLGTPAIQADPLAGLFLPLKVLAYEDGKGDVWLAYEDPANTFEDLKIPRDAEVLKKMSAALGKLTAIGAGG